MSAVNKRDNGIQILRAVLFIGIVAFHSGVPGSQILWGGVEVFFVISSYFLTKKLSKISASEIEVIPNIRHRISRLMPVYYLLLVGAFLVVAVLRRTIPIGDLLIHGVFSQNIEWMITGYKSELVQFTAHTWTLSIEVYLFIIWLLAFKLMKTDRSRLLFNYVTLVCAVVWRTVTTVTIGDPMITSLCPIAHMDAFAIGSLMALSEKEQSKKMKKFSWIVGLCGICVIVGSVGITAYLNRISFSGAYSLYKSSGNYLNHALTCNVYLGFSLLTVGFVQFSKLFNAEGTIARIFVSLGNLTYSAYLIHYPITVVLKVIFDNRWIVFGATTIITVLCSIIIEKAFVMISMRKKKA